MELATPRLTLRPLREDDAEAMFAYLSDSSMTEKAGQRAHESAAQTRAAVRRWVRTGEKLVLILRETGRLVGHISIEPDSEEGRGDTRELGFMLLPQYHGRGLMTEAVNAVVAALFAGGVAHVWACCFTDNLASKRLIEKCGFVLQQQGRFYSGSLDQEFNSYEYRIDRDAE